MSDHDKAFRGRTLITRRTVLLFALLALLSITAGGAMRRRDVRCDALRRSFARSAPWFSAKGGAHGFVCSDYDRIPLPDKLIAGAWCVALLAGLRSLLIDVEHFRQRQIAAAE